MARADKLTSNTPVPLQANYNRMEPVIDAAGKASGAGIVALVAARYWAGISLALCGMAIAIFATRLVVHLSGGSISRYNSTDHSYRRLIAGIILLVAAYYFPLIGLGLGIAIGIISGLSIDSRQYVHLQNIS